VREREVDLGGHPGLLVKPVDAQALYVLAHGAGAGMRHAFMAEISAALAVRRVATLRWEFPYMAAGKPRPDRAEVAERCVREVWAASRAHAGELPSFAGGKSFGGRMTSRAHAAAPLADLAGIAFLGFPLHPPKQPSIERAEHLARAVGPLLFVQGARDALADLALLQPVVTSLDATLHIIEHADHGFDVLARSGRTHTAVMAELVHTLVGWMDRIAGAKKSRPRSRSR